LLRNGINALIVFLVYALVGTSPEADDEEKNLAVEFVKDLILTKLGNIPYISLSVNAFNYGSIPIPVLSALNSIIKSMEYAFASKSENKKLKWSIVSTLQALGVSTGMPPNILIKLVRTLMDALDA